MFLAAAVMVEATVTFVHEAGKKVKQFVDSGSQFGCYRFHVLAQFVVTDHVWTIPPERGHP